MKLKIKNIGIILLIILGISQYILYFYQNETIKQKDEDIHKLEQNINKYKTKFPRVFIHQQGEEIEFINLTDNVQATQKYNGLYHFGDSEWESTLMIKVDNKISAKLKYGNWKDLENGKVTWEFKYLTLNSVKISKNIFLSDELQGKFVQYHSESGILEGLLINKSSIEIIGSQNMYEFGIKTNANIEF